MDRNSLVRTLVIALGLMAAYWFFMGRKSGDHAQHLPPETYLSAPGFKADVMDPAKPGNPDEPTPAAPPVTCTVKGKRFEAELSTHGAGLTHFWLTDPRYSSSDAHDMSTTPDVERWRN